MRPDMTAIVLIGLLPWAGCVRKPPVKPPASTVETAPSPPAADAYLARLLGVWKPSERGANGSQMIFESDGQLIFRGGLEYLNPAQWRLDRDQKELTLTLPQAPNEKLDIFKMYVGDGVKAFHRTQKEIVYHFDDQTTALNVAGWEYAKPTDAAPLQPLEAEPILK